MIRFDSDYTEGCIPEILTALQETNAEQTSGYGVDEHSLHAKELIKKELKNENVNVHLLVGGTQTNTTVISSVLRPHQGVLAPDSGHIATHESGAIEATGHKCLVLENNQGKISAQQVEAALKEHHESPVHEHMVQPGMVYISFPTESGTLYSKKELEEIYAVCKKWDIPLFIDGARMGYGLSSEKNDCALSDFPSLCDIFYIGGTKVGALFGEAVVIVDDCYKKDFRYHIKQHGGLLAKGRMLGIQFEQLFTNKKYFEISDHCIAMATKLKEGLEEKGYRFQYEAVTNQLFPILSNDLIASLQKDFSFQIWEPYDEDNQVVRFVTSFLTTEEQVQALLEAL